jgi:hypothetical protein
MKIYHYDFETGIYLGEGLADISPLEEGVWLIPAQATEIAPPEFKAGEYAAFINNEWTVETIPEIIPEDTLEVEPPKVIL